jgi:aspartyl-tRNA(Asn)/glutamyl-tRNA(Gln) amidotransferase subunit A
MSASLEGIGEIRAALDAGETSAVELVEAARARDDAVGERVRALLHPRWEAARAEAEAADARRASGEVRSPLDGIPIVLKDNIVQYEEPATCASKILEGYRSPFSATAVERLTSAGGIVVSRANMDEFAMGSSTENSVHGPSRNPWDLERAPGGSSGGSAAAVASGIVPGAYGSDTGGSIRQPAAFCGVVGMKPTYGRVSRWGLVAFASSLDQIGPFAHTAADCALLLDAVSGHDPRDSTSLPEPPLETAAALDGDVSGLVIGIPKETMTLDGLQPGVRDRVKEAVAELERAGAKTREVSLPNMQYGIAAYYLICTAEASSNLARFDGVRYGQRVEGPVGGITSMYEYTRSAGFGDEVKRRILLGTYALSAGYYDAYYRKAQQVRTLLRQDFETAFEACDVIATPTTPESAFKIGEKAADPLSMYLADVFTVTANLAGLPGVSVPCGRDQGLPVGLQILGPPLADAHVLKVADAYQRRTNHHEARPSL